MGRTQVVAGVQLTGVTLRHNRSSAALSLQSGDRTHRECKLETIQATWREGCGTPQWPSALEIMVSEWGSHPNLQSRNGCSLLLWEAFWNSLATVTTDPDANWDKWRLWTLAVRQALDYPDYPLHPLHPHHHTIGRYAVIPIRGGNWGPQRWGNMPCWLISGRAGVSSWLKQQSPSPAQVEGISKGHSLPSRSRWTRE